MLVTRTVAAALVGVVVLGFAGATARGDITDTEWSLTVMARVGSGLYWPEDTVTGTGLPAGPFAHDVCHTGEGSESIAESVYDFWATGDVGSFRFDFMHLRGRPYLSQAQSYGELKFTAPGEGLLYSLGGAYSLLGDQWISLSVVLEDITDIAPTTIFESYQASNSTPNQAFMLGGLAGDQAPFLYGALAGSLVGGRLYRLTYDYRINASEFGDTGACAEDRFLQMNLNPIPAPGAALLGVIGLGTVGWARRRIA